MGDITSILKSMLSEKDISVDKFSCADRWVAKKLSLAELAGSLSLAKSENKSVTSKGNYKVHLVRRPSTLAILMVGGWGGGLLHIMTMCAWGGGGSGHVLITRGTGGGSVQHSCAKPSGL